MTFAQRSSLLIGFMVLCGLSAAGLLPSAAQSQPVADRYRGDTGEIVVVPIDDASFVLKVPGMVIYNDPAGGAALFEGQPAPDLILACHEHIDHFDLETIKEIVTADTRLVVNPATMDKLPPELKARATPLANGEAVTIGGVNIEAIPAYHLVSEYQKYHPHGRDNGYVLTVDGRRIYISGDSDATPEMRSLKDIDIAFMSISPWTLTPQRGVSALTSFKPKFAYPNHYQSVADRDAFAAGAETAASATRVVIRDWHR